MNYTGIFIGAWALICIGIFHPIVIKTEYHWGVGCWWLFLVAGLAAAVGSLLVTNDLLSMMLGVFSCSCLWSIHELFRQRQRVKKGWFPKNPKRKY